MLKTLSDNLSIKIDGKPRLRISGPLLVAFLLSWFGMDCSWAAELTRVASKSCDFLLEGTIEEADLEKLKRQSPKRLCLSGYGGSYRVALVLPIILFALAPKLF